MVPQAWRDVQGWVSALAQGRLATYVQPGYSLLCGDVQSGKTQEMMLYCWWQRYVAGIPVVWVLRNSRADGLQLRDRARDFNTRMDALFAEAVHGAGHVMPHVVLRPVPPVPGTPVPEPGLGSEAGARSGVEDAEADLDDAGVEAADIFNEPDEGTDLGAPGGNGGPDPDPGPGLGTDPVDPMQIWSTGPGLWVALYNHVQLQRLRQLLDAYTGPWALCIDEVDITVRTRDRSDPTEVCLLELQARARTTLGVTATPLASLVTVPAPHRLLRLPPPPEYVGLGAIAVSDATEEGPMWTSFFAADFGRLLYVVDRRQAHQARTQELLSQRFPQATVVVYNGEGVRLVTPVGAPAVALGTEVGYTLQAWAPNPTRLLHTFTGPRYPLAAVLQTLKDAGPTTRATGHPESGHPFRHIIIIAGLLAARGISYVSRDYQWQLTDQYLVPPPTMSGENLLQSLRLLGRGPGRVPGQARGVPTLWCHPAVAADVRAHADAIRRWVDVCVAGGVPRPGEGGWRGRLGTVMVPLPTTHVRAVRGALWEAMAWRPEGRGRATQGRLVVAGPGDLVPDLRHAGGSSSGRPAGTRKRGRGDDVTVDDDADGDPRRFVISFNRGTRVAEADTMAGLRAPAPTRPGPTRGGDLPDPEPGPESAGHCMWMLAPHRHCRRPPYRDSVWCSQHLQRRTRDLQEFWVAWGVAPHDEGWPWRPVEASTPQSVVSLSSSVQDPNPDPDLWVDEGRLYVHSLATAMNQLETIAEARPPRHIRATWITVETFLGTWEAQYWRVDLDRLPVRVHVERQPHTGLRRGLVMYWN